MNYFHDMVDNIHQKRIWRPWNQCGSICLHLRRHIWNSRVHEGSPGAARQHPREFDTNNTHTIMFDPLNKTQNETAVIFQ